jgi:general secretion pathway protein L
MARLVGIDIGATHVRAALIRVSYRTALLERLLEVEIASVPSVEAAIQAASLPLAEHGEPFAVSIPGELSFIHRLKLPATALKQLEDVLPYEIEGQIPVDLSDLRYDYRVLRRNTPSEPVIVLAAAARRDLLQARIDLVRSALRREPERIGCGPLPLANLAKVCPELAGAAPVALIDLGGRRTEVVILQGGEPVFARTLSRGIEGLPDSAPLLAGELRQTLAAWLAQGPEEVQAAYLLGGGAALAGAEAYLAEQLGIPIGMLPALALGDVAQAEAANVPRFARAIALALSMGARPLDVDLRQGDLSFQRGWGFLKEKIPVLAGLGAAIFISFMFSTWAELKALDRESEALTTALAMQSKEALGEETTDPARALELLERAKGGAEDDPMPHMDGFGIMVELSNLIPSGMIHDIEELDLQRGHVKLHGIVGSANDAQTVATELGKHRCFKDPKVAKVTQVINSDRQKYVLEFDVRCPDDASAKKKKKKVEAAPAEGDKP